MIKDARSFLLLVGGTTKEDVLEDGIKALHGVVEDWVNQIMENSSFTEREKIRGAIYQGGLLGLQIAARARAQAAKKLAEELNIKLEGENG